MHFMDYLAIISTIAGTVAGYTTGVARGVSKAVVLVAEQLVVIVKSLQTVMQQVSAETGQDPLPRGGTDEKPANPDQKSIL